MGHGMPTPEEAERLKKDQKREEAHYAQVRDQAQRFDGLKSVATSAHVVIKEALPYINNDQLEAKMKDVLTRLGLWGAHP